MTARIPTRNGRTPPEGRHLARFLRLERYVDEQVASLEQSFAEIKKVVAALASAGISF